LLQDKIGRVQIRINSGQHDLHIGDAVAVQIGLDDRVSAGLVREPCHARSAFGVGVWPLGGAVGDDIFILTAIQKRLVSGDCGI